MKKLYICQCSDMSWYPAITEGPCDNGEFATNVGAYPVELYIERKDLNGSRVVTRAIADSEDHLLQILDFCGICRQRILTLWDFRDRWDTAPAVSKIFLDAENWNHTQAQEEIDVFIPDAPTPKPTFYGRLYGIWEQIQGYWWIIKSRFQAPLDDDLPF